MNASTDPMPNPTGGHTLGPLRVSSVNMYRVVHDNGRMVCTTASGDFGCDASIEYARLFADSPAAALILRMLCAGVIAISNDTLLFWSSDGEHAEEFFQITGTYTDLVTKIGWHRCVEALGEKV